MRHRGSEADRWPDMRQAAYSRAVKQNGGSQTREAPSITREMEEAVRERSWTTQTYTWNINNTQTGQTAGQTERERLAHGN